MQKLCRLTGWTSHPGKLLSFGYPKYSLLGSLSIDNQEDNSIQTLGKVILDLTVPLSKARSAFTSVKDVLKLKQYSDKIQLRLYNSSVKSVLDAKIWAVQSA